MFQVRQPRTQQVAIPPPTPGARELSREEREQLRIIRSHAFHRHQQNAGWIQEILEHKFTSEDEHSAAYTAKGTTTFEPPEGQNDTRKLPLQGSLSLGSDITQLKRHLEESTNQLQALQAKLQSEKEAYASEIQHYQEMFTTIRGARNMKDLQCVQAESSVHTSREVKYIKL